ncbi:Nn.00g037500.m01.CDS01 [Neocucurbitaria sp. VM-36]
MSTNPPFSTSPLLPRSAHSPTSPPLPHFEDVPEDESHEHQQPDDAADGDEIAYPEPSSEQMLLPPPNFRPFFTLIEDMTSGEHYHPYVHYVFADDDPVVLTAASMRSLGLDDTKYLPQPTLEHEERHQAREAQEEDEDDSPVESPLPPPIPGVREHYLIIDVGADGRTIIDAQSLSSEWQITDTGLRTAPSFDESSPDQGYMLRIEGVEIPKKPKGKGKGQVGQDKLSEAREQSQGDIFGALDGLVQGVERGLEVARKISGRPSKETEEHPVAGVPTEEEEKGVASEV